MAGILIVDDERHIRLLIEQSLEDLADAGVTLLIAGTGEEAIEVVRNQHPDLVFLDVSLPGMSGFDVCRAVKRDAELADTRVILLTGKGQQRDREEGALAGADGYVMKPFDPDELLAIARDAVGVR
jgi:two-component system alkaline phosphatase synthesis response regulator PhoP